MNYQFKSPLLLFFLRAVSRCHLFVLHLSSTFCPRWKPFLNVTEVAHSIGSELCFFQTLWENFQLSTLSDHSFTSRFLGMFLLKGILSHIRLVSYNPWLWRKDFFFSAIDLNIYILFCVILILRMTLFSLFSGYNILSLVQVNNSIRLKTFLFSLLLKETFA